jgi:hypothetical protein
MRIMGLGVDHVHWRRRCEEDGEEEGQGDLCKYDNDDDDDGEDPPLS